MDYKEFIAETLIKTISASRSRVVMFCIILFLQFLSVDVANMMTSQPGHSQSTTYNSLTQKIEFDRTIGTFSGLIRYLLLLILIIKSPAESTRKRRFAKYFLLFGALYLWLMIDLGTTFSKADQQESELTRLSFKENSFPIYGKVVFASYKHDDIPHKRAIIAAEKLSTRTDGYLVIVQLDRGAYPYPGLITGVHDFNYYTHDWLDTMFVTNIPEKTPNLSNCQQFIVEFRPPPKVIPPLPEVDKYVKIMYDSIRNGIEMYSDSTTATTPTFDSIPTVVARK